MRGMSNGPIISSKPRVPNIGKGGHKVRGTAAQRQAFYETFRAHTDEVRERLLDILRDPDADHGHVIQAAKEILNRGWGAVPQTQVIEAVFQHQHSLNVDALRQMPTDQLRQFEVALARLVEVDDAEVIETSNESVDHAPPPEAPETPRRRVRRLSDG
jgi:hypothetical protein